MVTHDHDAAAVGHRVVELRDGRVLDTPRAGKAKRSREPSRGRAAASRMSGFVALHIRPLRTHPLRALLSMSGVAVGIALMVSMIGLFSSMTSAADRRVGVGRRRRHRGVGAERQRTAGRVGSTEIAGGGRVGRWRRRLVRSNIVAGREPVMLLGFDERLAQIGGAGIDLTSVFAPPTSAPAQACSSAPACRDTASSLRLTTSDPVAFRRGPWTGSRAAPPARSTKASSSWRPWRSPRRSADAPADQTRSRSKRPRAWTDRL